MVPDTGALWAMEEKQGFIGSPMWTGEVISGGFHSH